MRGNSSIVLFLTAALAVAPGALAQEEGVYRLGFLSLAKPLYDAPMFTLASETQRFLDALGRLGYSEGSNLAIERRFADGDLNRLPLLAEELVRLELDLIMSVSTPAASALQKATSIIPVLFSLSADPVDNGFVASLARPGGNMTGYFWDTSYVPKWLQLLKELVPGLTRVARLCPSEEIERCKGPWFEDNKLGLQVEVMEAQGTEDFDRFFSAAEGAGFGAVFISPMASYYGEGLERRLGEAAARSSLPAVFGTSEFVESGGLIAYFPPGREFGERLAVMVDTILQGTDPAVVPVESPSRFELWLNLRTAQAQNIEIPPSIMIQATNIVE